VLTIETLENRSGASGSVVATDTASVDADCDNGTAFHSMHGSRRGDGPAISRVEVGRG
jgi:hypothetical protein